jgi:hypothetical protein
MKPGFILFITFLLFSSCDPGGAQEVYISNIYPGTIFIYRDGHRIDSIASNSEKYIHCDCGLSASETEPGNYFTNGKIDPFLIGFDSISNGTTKYNKDLFDAANWIYHKTGKYSYKYVLTVYANDF